MHQAIVSDESRGLWPAAIAISSETDSGVVSRIALPLRYARLPLRKRLIGLGVRLILATQCHARLLPEAKEQVMWLINAAMLRGELKCRSPEIMVMTFMRMLYQCKVDQALPLRAAVHTAVAQFMAENGGVGSA